MAAKDAVAIKRAEVERNWRIDLERLGADVVRTRFIARMAVTDTMPYPEQQFVQDWLARQDRNTKIRSALVVGVSVIAMVAACIAAWPVIHSWITHADQ